MNCPDHLGKPITHICTAPHTCSGQRKLCVICSYEHEVEKKHTVPIETFRNMVEEKIKGFSMNETSQLKKQLKSFRDLLLEIINLLKKNFLEVLKSIKQIKQIFKLIEQERNLFTLLINENSNLAESSYTTLEKLVKFLERDALDDWITSNNPILNEIKQNELYYSAIVIKLKDCSLVNTPIKIQQIEIQQLQDFPQAHQKKKRISQKSQLHLIISIHNS